MKTKTFQATFSMSNSIFAWCTKDSEFTQPFEKRLQSSFKKQGTIHLLQMHPVLLLTPNMTFRVIFWDKMVFTADNQSQNSLTVTQVGAVMGSPIPLFGPSTYQVVDLNICFIQQAVDDEQEDQAQNGYQKLHLLNQPEFKHLWDLQCLSDSPIYHDSYCSCICSCPRILSPGLAVTWGLLNRCKNAVQSFPPLHLCRIFQDVRWGRIVVAGSSASSKASPIVQRERHAWLTRRHEIQML